VMTARPGRLKEIVETKFDGAANGDIVKSPEFLDKVDYIWGIVREEAIAADAEKSE